MEPVVSETQTDSSATAGQDDGRVAFSQGFRWNGDDDGRLREVIDAAFDYRGNVTLHLRDGGELEGYLFNRSSVGDEPWVEVMPAAGGRERLPYDRIAGVSFTGKDTAAGKSWETWLRKSREKKAAEERGEDVGSIDSFPDE